jgi:nicotinamide-nucleotide amidase
LNAEIIAVGTEILLGQTTNTNAQYLSEQLALAGVNVYYHQVAGDNMGRLTDAISLARSRSDLIILCGGLGPTEDDLTREAVARVVERPLELDEGILEHLQNLFARLGREMTPNNRQQAMRIQGAEILHNPRGTAPGQYVEVEGRHYVILPGPPTEMRHMFVEQVIPIINRLMGQTQTIRSRVLRIFGIGEPAVEAKVVDLLDRHNPTIAPYASEGECKLRVTAKADSETEAFALIDEIEVQLRDRLGGAIYGVDQDTLPIVVGTCMKKLEQKLAVFEGQTGGVLTSLLTDVPVPTDYLTESLVVSDRVAALTRLGIAGHVGEGDVEERARAIAEGMRRYAGVDFALAIPDLLQPTDVSATSNIRDAYVAVAGPNGSVVQSFRIRGDGHQLRIRAAKNALYVLLQQIQA